MKRLILLVIISISLSSYGQSVKELDGKNGYKDLNFGMKQSDFLKNHEAQTITEDRHGVKTYDVTDVKYLSAGNCKVNNVSVSFFDSTLMEIVITSKDGDCLLQAFRTLYGNGYASSPYSSEILWKGKTVTMFQSTNTFSNKTTCLISSNTITKSFDDYSKSEAVKNAKDL